MRGLVVITAVLLLAGFAAGQPNPDTLWTRTYGGNQWDIAQSVQQTADGGYIVAGFSDSFGAGDMDCYVVKMDSAGAMLWTRRYGNDNDETAMDVQQTPDNGYVIAGTNSHWGQNSEMFLVKADDQGNSQWTRTYGGTGEDYAYGIRLTPDSGYVLAGRTTSFGATSGNVYVVKTLANGDTLWTHMYGGTGNDVAYSIQQTADSGYILAGSTASYGAGVNDFYVVKTDSRGDTVWTRTYGGRQDDFAYSVCPTSDGGYIIAGSTVSWGAGYSDAYVVKIDSHGDTLWTRVYGGTMPDAAYSVRQATDGGYVVAGYVGAPGTGARDIRVVKFDGQGQTLWTRNYGGTGSEEATCIQQTRDCGYVISGYTTSRGAGINDFWVVKTGPEPGATVPDIAVTPAALNFGNVMVGDSATLPLRIRSTGSGNLTVSRLTLPASYRADFTTPRTLTPGDSLTVHVTFIPSQVRAYADTLTVHSDAADSSVTVPLSGSGLANSVEGNSPQPLRYALAVYPNPFNPTTQISYTLPHNGEVSLTVCNLLGETVAELAGGFQSAGSHTVRLDGTALPTGLYLCRLRSGQFEQTQRMMLLK